MAKAAALVAIFFAVAAAAAHAQPQCNMEELKRYCWRAFDTEAKPTVGCCDTLEAQEHCFCQYARDPVYGDYFNTHGVRVTMIACGVPVPVPGC